MSAPGDTRRAVLAAGALGGGMLVLAGSCKRFDFTKMWPRDPARVLARGAAYGSDPRQTLDVYAPLQPKGQLPLLVFFYGGGWRTGKRQDYVWAGRALAAQGFVVAVADYRLAPQFTYPSFVQDGAAAVRWMQSHAGQFGADPSRTLLMGHSSGAYIAMQLALNEAFLQAAGVPYATIKGVVGLSGPYDFLPLSDSDSQRAFGPYPDKRSTQPIAYAGRPHRPPVMLIHGGRDSDVGPEAPISLDRALRAAGNTCILRMHPDLNHPETVYDLAMPFRYEAPILEESVSFLRAVAGGPV